MPPRPRALAPLALAGLLALTGCSSGGHPVAPTPAATAPTAGASTAAPASPSPAPVFAAPFATGPATKAFTGPAADEFGADAVMAAYRFATDYLVRTTFDPKLLSLREPRLTDLAFVEDGLTPSGAASFHRLAAELAVPGVPIPPQDESDLVGLVTYDVVSAFAGYTVRAPGLRDVGYGLARSQPFTGANRVRALGLYFPVHGTFLLTGPDGAPAAATYSKDMALTLARTGDPARPWLIDGWSYTRNLAAPVPDPTS